MSQLNSRQHVDFACWLLDLLLSVAEASEAETEASKPVDAGASGVLFWLSLRLRVLCLTWWLPGFEQGCRCCLLPALLAPPRLPRYFVCPFGV